MTQIATINTGNYAAMAEAMGMSVDSGKQKSQASTLAKKKTTESGASFWRVDKGLVLPDIPGDGINDLLLLAKHGIENR